MRIPATNVMITILRMAPRWFFIHECNNFLNKIKLSTLFDNKRTYLDGLRIVYEIVKGQEK
jgi:hypothetical protein